MLENIEHKLPTYGQLERDLSQMIYKLYREEFEHSPGKITCKFFSNNLAIVIEDSLTTIEKSLLEANKVNVVRNLNLAINNIIKSKLKILIEQVLAVEVCDILFDSSLELNVADLRYPICEAVSFRTREQRETEKYKDLLCPESKILGALKMLVRGS